MHGMNPGERVLRRDFDAKRLNLVVNHAEVRPWVLSADQGAVDLSSVVDDPRNIALMSDRGGLLFLFVMPTVYEVHTQFLPAGRGDFALEFAREALRWMFTRTDAIELWSKVPASNKSALGFVRAIHGRLEFTRPKAWKDSLGELVDMGHYVLRFPDWAQSDPALKLLGAWFHETLEAKFARAGITEPVHGVDSSHDAAVGATIATIRANDVDKALSLYNRWAQFAGYVPIGLVSRWPLVLDIGSALVVMNDQADNFDVLTKRGGLLCQ